MTCVIGYVDSKGIGHIAADSAGTDVGQHTRQDIVASKIFVKDHMLIGYTSSFRMGQIIECCLTLPEYADSKSDYHYLVTQFAPALRKCLVAEKYMMDTDKTAGTIIIVWRGNVYQMQDDFAVFCSPDKLGACGSGGATAISAFKALVQYGIVGKKGAEECLKKAVEISSSNNITVSGRIDYLKKK